MSRPSAMSEACSRLTFCSPLTTRWRVRSGMPLRREAPHDVGERLAELHRIRMMVCQFWQTVRKVLRLGDTPCMMLTRDLRLAGGADYSREGDRAWLREIDDENPRLR